MSAVRLRFKVPITLPVDARALAPDRLAGQSVDTLAAIELLVGNRRVSLGELAEIAAGDAPELVIEGSFGTLDRLGHGMTGGLFQIYGDAGAYLGQGMTGGRIELFGSAGIYAASQLRGGVIHVTANAGDFLGAALPGDAAGMEDGVVLVGGEAGDRVGERMRRGLIAVRGRLGDFAAARMIGGTILALRGCGANPGFAMRWGSVILGRTPGHLLATFTDNGNSELPWLRVLNRQLGGLEPPFELPGLGLRRWTGCASVGGKGELLFTD